MKKIALLFLMAVVLTACNDASKEESKFESVSTEVEQTLNIEEQKDVVQKYDTESRELLDQLELAADKMQTYMNENVAGTLNSVLLEEKQKEFIDKLDDLSYEAYYILDINGLPEEVGTPLESASKGFAEYFHSKMQATKIVFKMEKGDHEEFNKNSELALMHAASKMLEVKEKVGLPAK